MTSPLAQRLSGNVVTMCANYGGDRAGRDDLLSYTSLIDVWWEAAKKVPLSWAPIHRRRAIARPAQLSMYGCSPMMHTYKSCALTTHDL
jgi:hypothetical protein